MTQASKNKMLKSREEKNLTRSFFGFLLLLLLLLLLFVKNKTKQKRSSVQLTCERGLFFLIL